MPEPFYADELVTVHHGDCLDVLREMSDASVDAVVTDPPYGLGFMGREWDDLPPGLPFAAECLRVLKPGGHLLAFGGSRTWHRLAVAVEDAGFEVRDSIAWLYGSGFPKSLDVSKAIDKAAGAEREVLSSYARQGRSAGILGTPTEIVRDITAPASDDAKTWHGWGTALKPAYEPIVVGRKPLIGTVAANVLAHGTGALNIDGCRVASTSDAPANRDRAGEPSATSRYADAGGTNFAATPGPRGGDDRGRWPTNVVLGHAAECVQVGLRSETVGGGEKASGGFVEGYERGDGFVGRAVSSAVYDCAPGCQVAELDRQSGVLTSGANPTRRGSDKFRDAYGDFAGQEECTAARGADSGGASRFFPTFRYEAKAPTVERPREGDVAHPTVKPLDLMRWLVRLVTPPGGLVLDPFAGSGTTAEACVIEGFRCLTVEREAPTCR